MVGQGQQLAEGANTPLSLSLDTGWGTGHCQCLPVPTQSLEVGLDTVTVSLAVILDTVTVSLCNCDTLSL